MNVGTFKALEFDRIVEMLQQFALTPPGAARLARLRPHSDEARVARALALTTEGVRFARDYGTFPLRALADLDDALEAIEVAGQALAPRLLVALAELLASVDATIQSIRRTAAGSFPALRSLVEGAVSFDAETTAVRSKIDPTGEVLDHASPALRAIRDRLRRQRSRLRNTLESYLRGKDTSKYLQEQVVTDRNGRYVLVVKAEHRSSIPGIVHGSSASGASLFLEPLSTVEINNDIVSLEEEEAQEVHRILLELSDAFRRRGDDLARTLEIAATLDEVQAMARFSRLVDGIEPAIARDGRLEWRAARHPLLIPAVAARLHDGESEQSPREGGPVPVDILVIPPATALVITGPNTGGKTVALKTAGLLALMAQAGLHVPAAEGSSFPVFQAVFADIGDEQSIEANLSTFSWHMTNIAAMDRDLRLPALVLLDELGAGTDPIEGGALGMALIDHFRQRGALIIATTHYDALKSYASTTPGVVAAAFGFTPETFAPTYRLVYGSPGSSLALEIAARLGLPESVVAAARGYRSQREAQLAEHLARIDRELNALDHERRLVARERQQIAEQEARLRQRDEALRAREEQARRRVDAQLEQRLRDARAEIDRVVEDLKKRAATLEQQAQKRAKRHEVLLTTGDTGSVRADARAALDRLAEHVRRDTAVSTAATASDDRRPSRPATVGDRVAVGPLGLEGIVESLHGRDAEINVRGKRLRARLDDLRVLGGPGQTSRVNVQVQLQPRDTFVSDLNVIGCSIDEALARTDKFLDEAIVSEQRSVRVIHGHGTGQLRRAIAAFLQDHPQVARIGPAPAEQGGSGVTVVELKE